MNINFKAPLTKHDSSLGWYFIIFIPESLTPELGEKKSPRVKVTYNQKMESHVSVKSKGDVRYLVLNSKIRTKLKLTEGELVDVKIELETSKYGVPMPKEFSLMLEQDEEANIHFHNLTPGNQRNLIFLVGKLKNEEARIRKSLGIVEHLNEFNGKVEFKALNEKFKEINQRAK